MSNFYSEAINPRSGELETCVYLDDYFGKHKYGVRFPSDGMNAPTYGEAEVAMKTRRKKAPTDAAGAR